MDLQQEIVRGNDAERLLREPLLREALDAIEDGILTQLAMRDLPPEQVIHLRYLFVAKREFERRLTQFMKTGEMSSLAEQQKRSFADKFRNVVGVR